MNKIIVGDCLDILKTLDAESVQCCVTSPPYFGLRNYGNDAQIGLEPTPSEYVAKIVEVFAAVRRVLRKDGAVWINLGDSYASSGKKKTGRKGAHRENINGFNGGGSDYGGSIINCGSTPNNKPEDLLGIPWRVAFALQADGWRLRNDIIWVKPNPMPESVRDRCTRSHEHIFLLSKSAKYHYDYEAIKEPAVCEGQSRGGSKNRYEQNNAGMDCKKYDTRNKRDVWTVTPAHYKGAHFATYPPKLIRPCVLAGCPAGGVVLDPFSGAGTTGVVCKEEGRDYIGIELNPEYAEMSTKRIARAETRESLFQGENK